MQKKLLPHKVPFRPIFLFVLYFLLTQNSNGQTNFSFSLGSSAKTSAGVYLSDGTLVRTLWSGDSFASGTHNKSWDGMDDEGRLVPDGNYQIKVLSNNVQYTWEGVIGNTSTSLTGPSIHRGYHRVHGMAASGDNVYLARNYSEVSAAQGKFNTTNPQVKIQVMPSDGTNQESKCVATDGNIVYWGGVDPFFDDKSFIFGTKVIDDSEVIFSSGTPIDLARGRIYPSALNIVNSTNSWITGLAVQKDGDFLFASRKGLNKLYILNKITGASVFETTEFDSVQYLAVDGNDNLWIHYKVTGSNVVKKFAVDPTTGNLTDLNITLPGIVSPQAIAVANDGLIVVVADGGSSQQLKAYNNTTGSILWTYGQLGGYATNSTVANDKFYFDDPAGKITGSAITFQQDGSFWVADGGNYRIQHFSSSRNYINTIMYLPHNYTCVVDKNNPSRVFAGYLEFQIDYSRPLSSNNGSWVLARNWGYNVPKNRDSNYNKLSFITTLSNNRTYALVIKVPTVANDPTKWEVVELENNGTLRFTGIEIDQFYTQLYPDGSLRRTVRGVNTQFLKKELSGFANGNPVWDSESIIASAPPKLNTDPLFNGNERHLTSSEITSSNLLISFNGSKAPLNDGGYHLGAIKVGENKWLWKTAKSTHSGYQGQYPDDGSFDIGNGVGYAGSIAMAIEKSIFWGYVGEFWKNGQTNKWQHVYDNGLLLSTFGTIKLGNSSEAPSMMAGNAFAGQIVKDPLGSGDYFLYHNDENHHAGIHRWRISGLNTIQEQAILISKSTSLTQNGLLGNYHNGNSLNNTQIKTTRVDEEVNFNWLFQTPVGTEIDSNNYSISWTGFVKPLYTETYNFFANVDGGVKVWIDGKLLIDQRTNQSQSEFNSSLSLLAGVQYPLRIEYYKFTGSGLINIAWSSPSQLKQIIPSSQLFHPEGLEVFGGVDLLEGLGNDSILVNNLYGWTRFPAHEINTDINRDYWSAKPWIGNQNKFESADLFIRYRQKATGNNYTIQRDLGINSSNYWKMKGIISLDLNFPNSPQNADGMFLEILDESNNIIARFYAKSSGTNTIIYCNNEIMVEQNAAQLAEVFKYPQNFEVVATSAGLSFKYADFVKVNIPKFESASNWQNPKTLKLFFFHNSNPDSYNNNRIIDIQALNFSTYFTPNVPTIIGDDISNTLSASHSAGISEIVISENGSPFVAYAGEMSVGNVDRAEGYWKFKIKAAPGRLESEVVNSPAFTAVYKPLPGKIEAEAFDRQFGIQTQATIDVDGGLNVGFIDNNDWIDYDVNVSTAGNYAFNFRIAGMGIGGQFQIRNGAGQVLATLDVPNTGAWQTYTNVYSTINLPAGNQVLRIYSIGPRRCNINWFESNLIPNPPTVIGDDTNNTLIASHELGDSEILVSENDGIFSAYSGPISVGEVALLEGHWKFKIKSSTERTESEVVNSPSFTTNYKSIPGKIEAESFDAQFGIQTQATTDVGGGLNVGYIDNNDWMDYFVNVSATGNYIFKFRIAGMGTGGQFQVRNSNAQILSTINVPHTGGWQIYTNVNDTIALQAGPQVLRIYSIGPRRCNINWFEATAEETPPAGARLAQEEISISNTELKVYPNPFSKDLKILLNSITSNKVKLHLYSSEGLLINVLFEGFLNSEEIKEINFEGDKLRPGIYLIKLITNDNVITHKVILSK